MEGLITAVLGLIAYFGKYKVWAKPVILIIYFSLQSLVIADLYVALELNRTVSGDVADPLVSSLIALTETPSSLQKRAVSLRTALTKTAVILSLIP